MATWTKLHDFVMGDRRTVIGTVTFSNSYTTGGEAMTLKTMGAYQTAGTATKVPTFIEAEPTTANAQAVYDRTNNKWLLFTNGSTQATNASDQSAVSVIVRIETK